MAFAFIFPGQGSQYIGMGQALNDSFLEAREVFQEVDEALSQNLSRIMFAGDVADLNLTENTQPALMAVSLAVMRVLEKQGGVDFKVACRFVAGHSLGEYSALTAVGALDVAVCAKLLKVRGQAMQKAVPVGVGAMAAIIGPSFDAVQAIADDAGCEVANDNSVGQVVISGSKETIDKAIEIANERGAKRALLLPVSAPFHCSLMQPAADVMKDELSGSAMVAPAVPVVSNVTAEAVSDPEEIKSLLVEQVTGLVRWRESVVYMKDHGVVEMVEIGAGKVLSGLVRRIDKEIACQSVEAPEQIEALIERLKS